ncbi:hypothetical protein IV417_15475 [Alphaproteobacteria bacterium KMM 3653]|uniref:Uncharacterized protein n=1 Tax=Harenicola maris TaxID=2841044 RepID=A0AAP2CQQ8_9RHOB|nr:hypothetical protein [Harenicola maris]
MRLPLPCAAALALVVGCTPFPDLDGAVSENARSAAFPTLIPLDGLIAGAGETRITPATTAGLSGSVAALRARAARLQRPVIEPALRARMQAALARRRP